MNKPLDYSPSPASHRLVAVQGRIIPGEKAMQATCSCGATFDAEDRQVATDLLVMHQEENGTKSQRGGG